MNQIRVVFCTDVHLCHGQWYARSSEQRMERMVERRHQFYPRRDL